MPIKSVEDRVSALLSEYTQLSVPNLHYDSSVSLRSLGLESLALVSLILRIGDECEVDVTDFAMELNSITTVGELYSFAHKLQKPL